MGQWIDGSKTGMNHLANNECRGVSVAARAAGDDQCCDGQQWCSGIRKAGLVLLEGLRKELAGCPSIAGTVESARNLGNAFFFGGGEFLVLKLPVSPARSLDRTARGIIKSRVAIFRHSRSRSIPQWLCPRRGARLRTLGHLIRKLADRAGGRRIGRSCARRGDGLVLIDSRFGSGRFSRWGGFPGLPPQAIKNGKRDIDRTRENNEGEDVEDDHGMISIGLDCLLLS